MIHELRIYNCMPGMLPALNDRFANITLKLFEKHGIRQAGFWTTAIGENNQRLTYLLEWDDLADRDKRWGAFQNDPEWIAARAKTEENGAIVATITNEILIPTAYSSVK